MTSDFAVIAQAIVDDLNAAGLTPAFTAARALVPTLDLSTIGDAVQVLVVPRSATFDGGTRLAQFADLAIDIGVQAKVNVDDPASADPLLALVQAIGVRLRGRTLAGAPGAQWRAMSNEPAMAADHLAKFQVLTSVLTVTYRVARS